ncbi:MAG: hypothetical protein Q8O37_10985, partial [Sulfuricellaceae bacterium]|nr:hypothetical protein [Sulfuricellaceae bacterium]
MAWQYSGTIEEELFLALFANHVAVCSESPSKPRGIRINWQAHPNPRNRRAARRLGEKQHD